MKVLGIVPARAGSKRVARKNVRPLAGKPLVRWAMDAAGAAGRLSQVVVSSDDPDVLAIAEEHTHVAALKRPAELAEDTSPVIDYVRHALSVVGPHDVIVIVQPTSPLTLPGDIDATVDLLEESGADTAVSVVEVAHDLHPRKFKRMVGDRLLPYFEEEQGRTAAFELPRVFVRNCSVYATRAQVIDSGVIIGEDCRGYVMPRERSVDINDELDLAFAEFLVNRGLIGQ